MLEFKRIGETSRDCTTPYEVILDKSYKVAEFITEVLTTRSNEWGEFRVKCKADDNWFYYKDKAEYRYGKIVTRDGIKTQIAEEYASLAITKVYARGGWSCMDYELFID